MRATIRRGACCPGRRAHAMSNTFVLLFQPEAMTPRQAARRAREQLNEICRYPRTVSCRDEDVGRGGRASRRSPALIRSLLEKLRPRRLAHPFRESHRSPVNVRGHQAIEVPALVNARAGHPSLRAV